jgi:hypothetical protein
MSSCPHGYWRRRRCPHCREQAHSDALLVVPPPPTSDPYAVPDLDLPVDEDQEFHEEQRRRLAALGIRWRGGWEPLDQFMRGRR